MSRVCFHVDLDAFFASVERLDDPSLVGKPVVVGAAPGHRGVVSTCSYEARACGIHSAMPISEAYRLCPHAVFLPVRMKRYAELSSRIMDIFAAFTPDFRPVSIDEAFLDMTGTERLWGPAREAALRIKSRVFEETGLTISVGVAPNPYVAKIASGLKKPDGLVLVEPGGEESFMLSLPLGKLWGAGEKTQERFKELGISCIAQLANLGEAQLASLFGNAGARFLYAASRGRDPGLFGPEAASHSLSAETTLEHDSADPEQLEDILLSLAEEISYRLWIEGSSSRTLVLKLRYHDFSTMTRRCTRPRPYASAGDTYSDALGLLKRHWDGRSHVRLLGLGFADLSREAEAQGELFEDESLRRRRAETAVHEIEKSGRGHVTRARLLGKERRAPWQDGESDPADKRQP